MRSLEDWPSKLSRCSGWIMDRISINSLAESSGFTGVSLPMIAGVDSRGSLLRQSPHCPAHSGSTLHSRIVSCCLEIWAPVRHELVGIKLWVVKEHHILGPK